MNNGQSISHPWYAIESHSGKITAAFQRGGNPPLGADQVLIAVLAASVCQADVRVATNNKAAHNDPNQHVILGHEGIGVVLAYGRDVVSYKVGDYVVVLPHVHRPGVSCSSGQIDPRCIGLGHTLHMGWQANGCFADYIVVPATNIVRVTPENCWKVKKDAPDLQEAIFALVEPMMCTLSAYQLMETQLQKLARHRLGAGRALVIGCGPIGILHCLALLDRGFDVYITDTLPKREILMQWCLKQRVTRFNSAQHNGDFDLVMIAASSSKAISTGEELVRDGGILYVFAGLNTADQQAMNQDNVFFYERLHRTAQGLLTTARLTGKEKSILYLGHSGYFANLANHAITMVARHAAVLDRSITGVMRGWTNPCIEARLPGASDWTTADGSPALIAVLQGLDLRHTHCKLLVLTDLR
jgi:threonine dehydrogenase-like Zn-dependent dehydrogenase